MLPLDTTEAVARVCEELRRRTGLELSVPQTEGLSSFVRSRLKELGLRTPSEYLAKLDDADEFRRVVAHLTVPETYFFRFEEQFQSFRSVLLPRMLARARAEGRRARLWSAGCCTGEEPYTLALIAADAGCLGEVELLATDINEEYLESAVRGRFSRRSVERVPPRLLGSQFEREGDVFVLSPALRRSVAFARLNLAEEIFPSFLNGTAGLDGIFCRNVLIYFEKSAIPGILGRFHACLREGGFLAAGPSEMILEPGPFTPEKVLDAFFYLKDLPRASGETARSRPRRILRPARAVRPENEIEEARRLADTGLRAEAVAACRRAVERHPLDVRAHYLLGLLEGERSESARECFRRVLFLEPGHVMARLHHALCLERLGLHAEALREFRSLERLASTCPAEDLAEPAEGLSFGLLALYCRQAVERLERGI